MSKHVVCIGAALMDELYYLSNPILLATTNVATLQHNAGGVSRNIAHQLALLQLPVNLISVFGKDEAGNRLRHICESAGIDISASVFTNATGKYTGIINADGTLFSAFITYASEHLITSEHLMKFSTMLSSAAFILADANVNTDTIQWLINFTNCHKVPFIIEPVSVPPAKKLLQINIAGLDLISPNEDELPVLCSEAATTTELRIEELLGRGVQNIWLHNGAHGSTIFNKNGSLNLPAPNVIIKDCTGAGDASVAGWILGKWLLKNDLECLMIAHTLSAEVLQVKGAIATGFNQQQLLQKVNKYYPA